MKQICRVSCRHRRACRVSLASHQSGSSSGGSLVSPLRRSGPPLPDDHPHRPLHDTHAASQVIAGSSQWLLVRRHCAARRRSVDVTGYSSRARKGSVTKDSCLSFDYFTTRQNCFVANLQCGRRPSSHCHAEQSSVGAAHAVGLAPPRCNHDARLVRRQTTPATHAAAVAQRLPQIQQRTGVGEVTW